MQKAANSTIVDLHGISEVFKRPSGEPLSVFEKIDLILREGEILGLLGRSDSGKSALLRIAAGLIKPTGGTVDGAC